MQPLLDRSTEAKNKKLPREQTDWWFPIVLNDYQFLAKKSDGVSKVIFPSFAAHPGISTDDFKTIKNNTRGKWKKMKQIQFPCGFRKHAGIDWILLGESEAGNIFPKDQIDGRIHAPKWRGDVNLDFKVVSAREKVQSQYERACAQKNELPEYEAEIDDEDSTEEVMPAKNMGCTPGSKDE